LPYDRIVSASTEDEACKLAVEMVRAELVKRVDNDASDPPEVYATKSRRVAQRQSVGSGFIFYPVRKN
jgi:hypothetical protein